MFGAALRTHIQSGSGSTDQEKSGSDLGVRSGTYMSSGSGSRKNWLEQLFAFAGPVKSP